MEKKLSAAQYNMERNMFNITYKDWKTNKWVRDQTKVMDIMEIIKNRKWTWEGHVSRRTDNRWSAAVTVWTSMGGKRNWGRQRKKVERWTTTVLGHCELVHENKKPRTFGGNILKLSSCSGLIMAEYDDDDDFVLYYRDAKQD